MTTGSIDEQLAAVDRKIAEKQLQVESVQQVPKAPIWWSTTNAMTMSATVLIFGTLVIVFATYLIRRGKSSEAVLRIFGTLLIIVIAVFLVVAGYSDTQISPVMGLLGTVAGYLLGKENRERPGSDSRSSGGQDGRIG
jgi:uncharacterized membrane protein